AQKAGQGRSPDHPRGAGRGRRQGLAARADQVRRQSPGLDQHDPDRDQRRSAPHPGKAADEPGAPELIFDVLEPVLHGRTRGPMDGLVAAGLALMLGVARLINFAHGEFFMLGAYIFWFGYSELGLPYSVAALLAPVVMVGFGIAYQRTVIRAILPR